LKDETKIVPECENKIKTECETKIVTEYDSSIFTCKNLSCPWIIFIFNLSGDIVVLNS
jgi:hypothetical protein